MDAAAVVVVVDAVVAAYILQSVFATVFLLLVTLALTPSTFPLLLLQRSINRSWLVGESSCKFTDALVRSLTVCARACVRVCR